MASAFQLARGVTVPDLTGIEEGYSILSTEKGFVRLLVNVSAGRIQQVFLQLARLVEPPAFIVIEVPTNVRDEEKLRTSDTDPFHKDVHYLDGVGFDRLEAIFARDQELLVHDGMVTFGFGSHGGVDEVRVGKYKIFEILARQPGKYLDCLSGLGYGRREPLKTVRDTFTRVSPGTTERIEVGGRTVYDIVEDLRREGLYFAERRVS